MIVMKQSSIAEQCGSIDYPLNGTKFNHDIETVCEIRPVNLSLTSLKSMGICVFAYLSHCNVLAIFAEVRGPSRSGVLKRMEKGIFFIYKYLFIWMKCSRIEDFLPESGLLVLPEGSSSRLLGFKRNVTFDKRIGKLVSGCFQSGLQTSCGVSCVLEFFLTGFIFLKLFWNREQFKMAKVLGQIGRSFILDGPHFIYLWVRADQTAGFTIQPFLSRNRSFSRSVTSEIDHFWDRSLLRPATFKIVSFRVRPLSRPINFETGSFRDKIFDPENGAGILTLPRSLHMRRKLPISIFLQASVSFIFELWLVINFCVWSFKLATFVFKSLILFSR